MSHPGPVLPLAGPLLAAAVTFALRRWPRLTAAVGAATAWLLAGMTASVPLTEAATTTGGRFAGDTWLVFGHALVLTDGVRALLLFLYAGFGLLFLLSWVFAAGRNFVPASLGALVPLAILLMIRPLTLGIVFWLVAATCLVIVVQAGQARATAAALRYLIIAVLAVPLLLMAGWMLDTGQATLLAVASRLLLVAFVVLLAGFPAHIWVGPIVDEAPVLSSVALFSLAQLVVIVYAFDLRLAYPWLQQEAQLWSLLRWSGTGTAVAAAALALTAGRFSRLLASTLLLDMGLALLALTLPDDTGRQAAVSLHVARFFSLLMAGVGLSLLCRHSAGDIVAENQGLARRAPFSVALFVYGCLSLVGLPLTVGFGGHWVVITAVAQQTSPWLPFLLLSALVGAAYAVVRALLTLVAGTGTAAQSEEEPWLRGVLALAFLAGLWLAAFPQTLLAYAYRLADLFG